MQNAKKMISSLLQLIDESSKILKKAILKIMLIKKNENEWIFGYGYIIFSDKKLEPNSEIKYSYPKILLIKEEYKIEDIRVIIENLLDNLSIEINSHKIELDEYCEYRFIPSFIEDSGITIDWPSYVFKFQKKNNNFQYNSENLFSETAPYFPNLTKLFHSFFQVNAYEVRDIKTSYLNIIFPDFQGRFREVRITDEKLIFKIDSKLQNLEKFGLKIYYKTPENEFFPDKNYKLDDNEQVIVNTGIFTREFEAVLFNKNKIIDKVEYYPDYYYRQRSLGIIQENTQRYLENLIADGENLNIEFKERYNKNKRDECIETIVSFSNTKGGTIYFGVSDQGNICGIDNPKDYESTLLDWIDKFCLPPIEAKVQIHQINDKYICSIIVPEGKNKPYFLKNSNMEEIPYIRRGSTDRKMKRNELEKIYNQIFEEKEKEY